MEKLTIVEPNKKYTLKIEMEIESDLTEDELRNVCQELLKDKVASFDTEPFIIWDKQSIYIPVIDKI